MRRIDIVRWLLVIPSAVVAWYFAFVVSLIVFSILIGPCMDTDLPKPSFCEASWIQFSLARDLDVRIGVGLSAVMVVTVAAIVAPYHHVGVAWVAFSVGAVIAGVIAYTADAVVEGVVAIAAGLLAALLVTRFARGSRDPRVARTDVVPTA